VVPLDLVEEVVELESRWVRGQQGIAEAGAGPFLGKQRRAALSKKGDLQPFREFADGEPGGERHEDDVAYRGI